MLCLLLFFIFILLLSEIRCNVNFISLLLIVLFDSLSDVYRFFDLMFDLVEKLGCWSEIDCGFVWGMVGCVVIVKEDWVMVSKVVENMV